MILNLIETLKTSTYNPKRTPKHENTFSKFQNVQKYIFFTKKQIQRNKRFMVIFIALLIYVEGHTA